MDSVKVAVTGAAGQIGYSLLFRIASGEMFGPRTAVDLSLIEVPQAMQALAGVIMEIEDCAFPLLKKISATDNLKEGFDGADWALLVGSVPRKAGMERNDLLKINGGIFVDQGKALDSSAKEACKILVVGNPCNTNAFIAKSVCRRIPKENFFAMTLLDQNRAAAQLAARSGAGVDEVSCLAVWGNHSATQYPDFYNAKIQGKPAIDIVGNERWLQEDFIAAVQRRGAAVIEARGKSSAASAANAVVGTVKGLVLPTAKGEFFSVAVSSDGSYGIDEGTMFSFPVRTDGKKWEIVKGLAMNEFAEKKIRMTLEELRMEKAAVQKILS